ncbi:MAG: ribose-5-phosphate isomerase RpiA [Spirochaetaceae bacterium]|jgi:ribose 5-phosphate isomerase A|nr:ribose-5-phosphate isomerase RpiA [Spirochaetaceae bacterium]
MERKSMERKGEGMDKNEIKAATCAKAVEDLVKSGMKVGLGTGSTAIHAVREIGLLIGAGKLTDIFAVPTSFQTLMACETWGIPLYTLNSKEINGALDLTIDGADEVDPNNYCVKGGGGALLLEKIVAYASAAYAIVADESKAVDHLALRFPAPLEIVPEARVSVIQAVEAIGASAVLREAVRKAGPVITEHGNLLLDITFRSPVDPALLERELNQIPGGVENGFFTRLSPRVFIGRADGTVEVRPAASDGSISVMRSGPK